jgi:uncharacterized protein (TIGR02246 family)
MSVTMQEVDRREIEALVATLEAAWNAADGTAYAAMFTDDADFVNIRGEHHRGRAAIAAGHDAILATIYAGSRNQLNVESIRLVRDDVAVAHVSSTLDSPAGPLPGVHVARFSLVLLHGDAGWRATAFQNTYEGPAARA